MIEQIENLDYESIIGTKIIDIIVEKGIGSIRKLFSTSTDDLKELAQENLSKNEYNYFIENYNLKISETQVLKNISFNLNSASNWSSEVNFSTAISSKLLKDIFVDINLYLSPLNQRFDTLENTEKISSKLLLKDFSKNKIIYGVAGAGKTTLIKKIYGEFLNKKNEFNFTCPIVIRFRELDFEKSLIDEHFGLYKILLDILGIHIKLPTKNHPELFNKEYHNLIKQTVVSFLDDSNILLIADGFDEIPNIELKEKIEKEFLQLSLALNKARFILTSRSGDFKLKLPNTETYEICGLDDYQIKKMINRWLNDDKKSKDLFNKIKSSPYYDTTMRPLTLSHLCAIYERKKTIPPKPRYIYDFVLNLLLEAWDQQRSIVRPSNYANFYIEKKKEFLAHLAYWLTCYVNKTVFNSDEIKSCYEKIYKVHNLPVSQAKKVVSEIETHTGIFVQSGYQFYEFSHKSLQEFLTAKYLTSLPKIPEIGILNHLPNELAICLSLSSSPNYYFEILNDNFTMLDEYFWAPFLNRLITESPDFDENPSVIIFFLNNMDNSSERNLFKKIFLELLNKTNLNISISSFFNLYLINDNENDNGSYLNKNRHRDYDEEQTFPFKLRADKEIHLKLINYT